MLQTFISKLPLIGNMTGPQAAGLLASAMLMGAFCGIMAFVFRRHHGLPGIFGFWGVLCSAALLLPVAACGLSGALAKTHWQFAWSLPLGSFTVGVDSLTAFFLLPLALLGPLAALHSRGYLKGHGSSESDGVYWLFFNLLFVSMALVLCARDGILFLLAWELMGVSSFVLVAHNHSEESVRSAAWKYLVASHVGAAFLLAMFALLSPNGLGSGDMLDGLSGAFSFAHIGVSQAVGPVAAAAFILALFGFGLKAGFVPLHVWLPEAHPAAPAPVSALMSGIMIKLGLYGILRVMSLLGDPCVWWAWTLLAIGAVTGIYGAICALSQSDLKRLLAYSSVENIGIAVIGLGLGVAGMAQGNVKLGLLGFAGAFLHILNHAAMKGLLFLSAGAVAKATGTLELERLGGLMKRMPWTGSGFLVGAAAISGLPPFNGFLGEFLIILAAFDGILSGILPLTAPSVVALSALAVISGLAPAIFAKAMGAVFLGEPRSEAARNAKEVSASMIAAQMGLALLCLALAVLAPRIVALSIPAIAKVSGFDVQELASSAAAVLGPLLSIGIVSSVLLAALAVAAFLRGRLPRAGTERLALTWDCGYAAPSSKMQYGGSSLTQPLRDIFRFVFRPLERLGAPSGPFPARGFYSSSLPDIANRFIIDPLFKAGNWLCSKLHFLQAGHLHFYIVMIMAALLLMLLWAWINLDGGPAQ